MLAIAVEEESFVEDAVLGIGNDNADFFRVSIIEMKLFYSKSYA